MLCHDVLWANEVPVRQLIKQRIQEETGGQVLMSFKFLRVAIMSIVNSYLKDYLLSYILFMLKLA